jgi:ankyrin repeat protein
LLTNKYGDTVLNVAVKEHNDAIWRLALEKRPEAARVPNTLGEIPLHNADTQAIGELVSLRGSDVNARTVKGETALYLAASKNDLGRASCLLEKQARVDIATIETRRTALHAAVLWSNDRLVKLLLEHGAEPSAQDNCGRTPLHYAAQGQSILVLKLLLEKTCPEDKFRLDNLGRSPVHLIHSLPDAVGLLADKGHQILNQLDYSGLSPLHLASRSATPEVVKALIDYGASIKTRDRNNRTPAEALCWDQKFWMPRGSSPVAPDAVGLGSGIEVDETLKLTEQHRLDTLDLLLSRWRDPSESCWEGLSKWKSAWYKGNRDRKAIISKIEDVLDRKGSTIRKMRMAVGTYSPYAGLGLGSLAMGASLPVAAVVSASGYGVMKAVDVVKGTRSVELIGHYAVNWMFRR